MINEEVTRKNQEYEKEFREQIENGTIQLYTNEYLEAENKKQEEFKKKKYAHPDAMRKMPATILLILGIMGSFIFKQWYLVAGLLLMWYFGTKRV